LKIHDALTVVGNGGYHSTVVDKALTLNTKEVDIVAWLSRKNILHEPQQTGAELLTWRLDGLAK
jgi:hypothetical protein